MNKPDLVAAALALHALGLHVFPVDHPDQSDCIGAHKTTPCDGTRGKHPACTWGTWAQAATDKMIEQAWANRRNLANIGIACGPSNLVVLDEDQDGELDRWCTDHGITLPDTYEVTTGRGRHVCFEWDHSKQRIGNCEKAFEGYKINVRGHGGFVVGAGSRHASGADYVGNGKPRAELPQEVADLLLADVSPPDPQPDWQQVPTGPNNEMIAEGDRHKGLVKYAGRLRDKGLDYDEAEVLFHERWLLCEQPDGEIPEAKFHTATCPDVMTWDYAKAQLADVFGRYPAGQAINAVPTIGPAVTLTEAHETFRKWLGQKYDTDALDVALAAVAVEQFTDGSDPVWVLVVSGSGAAKTETVQAFTGAGALKTSSLSSEAALLSATPVKQRSKKATGGLLRRMGARGVLIIKDVTSILSMNTDTRTKMLAALREVYDGHWDREVGAEGGQVLTWDGRIVVVGAVTTAWDTHREVIAAMGDRFVLIRIDSSQDRIAGGRQAIRNTGHEEAMRKELSDAVGGVIAGMNTAPITLADPVINTLLEAANLVTLARTSVVYDYKGDVIDAHAPEANTRFPKQLTQIVRGGVAVGMDQTEALRLAIRCARDSMPPMRLAIIDDLAMHPYATPTEVRQRLGKPRATVDRQLKALHILGVCTLDEQKVPTGIATHYTLHPDIDPDALKPPAPTP